MTPPGRRVATPAGLALLGCVLAAVRFTACAPATTSTGAPPGRTEEQVATRGSGSATPLPVGPARGAPLSGGRAVHGKIDLATGRRTAEPAVESQLREPVRAEIQTGRVRRAGQEYQPGGGELPYGHRIQVVATADFTTAGRQAARLKELLGGRLPVYLEFIDPYYKVRLGDFATEEEAVPVLEEVRRSGYPDAWTVRTTIKQADLGGSL